jgi:ABC-type transporter Mla MlaB component
MDGLAWEAGDGRLVASGELTIYQAEAAKGVLAEAFGEGGVARLELGEVSELDTAGLQLLLLARDTAAARGEPLELGAVSDAARAVLDLARVDLATPAERPVPEAEAEATDPESPA